MENKLWYTHSILSNKREWTVGPLSDKDESQSIMLNERSLTWKATYSTIHLYNILEKAKLQGQKRGQHLPKLGWWEWIATKCREGILGGGAGGGDGYKTMHLLAGRGGLRLYFPHWEAEVGRSWSQEIETSLANMWRPHLK